MGNQETAAGTFATTSLGWQWQQFRQWVGEWIELQWAPLQANPVELPNWIPPLWAQQAILGFVLGALLGWLVLLSGQVARRYYRQWQRRSASAPLPADSLEAMEILSVPAWLMRSRQYQQQGRYREACDALYRALLQHLADTQIAPPLASRTDREYLQLLQAHPQLANYQIVIVTHEQAHFGGLAVSDETWQRCQPVYRALVSL